MTKYRNKKTIIDWIKFDSKSEAEYFLKCKSNQNIKNFILQPKYIIQEKIWKRLTKVSCNWIQIRFWIYNVKKRRSLLMWNDLQQQKQKWKEKCFWKTFQTMIWFGLWSFNDRLLNTSQMKKRKRENRKIVFYSFKKIKCWQLINWKKCKHEKFFASWTFQDDNLWINMASTWRQVPRIAVRWKWYHDRAIYSQNPHYIETDWIRSNQQLACEGDKIPRSYAKQLVACNDEAFVFIS